MPKRPQTGRKAQTLLELIQRRYGPDQYEELAEQIGVSRSTIYAWLRGRSGLRVRHAARLAEQLGVSMSRIAAASQRAQDGRRNSPTG